MTYDDLLLEWTGGSDSLKARSSGSTGEPKLIELPKNFVKKSACATINFFKLGHKSHLHSCISPDFIGGKMMMIRSLISGASFSYEDPSSTPLRDFDKSKPIDLLAVVPTQMLHILNTISALPPIRNIIVGGSAIHPVLRFRIARSGLNCYETYGMTETASHIGLRRITESADLPFHPVGMLSLSLDTRGCLVVDYPDGLQVVTNDLATILPDGDFLIHGRIDNIIVTGGKKLNPSELEEELSRLAGVEVIVSSISDEIWGEKVVAIVESEKDIHMVGWAVELSSLDRWKLPKSIISLAHLGIGAFPKTEGGKLERMRLRSLLNDILHV